MPQTSNLRTFWVILLAFVAGTIGGGVANGLTGDWALRAPTSAVTTTPVPMPRTAISAARPEEPAVAAIRKISPSVVTIESYQTPNSGAPDYAGAPKAFGSGLVIDPSGLIVTNNHVVERSQSLFVLFGDGSSAEGKIVGTDALSDIAVIKVKGPLPYAASLGDSSALELGQMVMAIGSPLDQFRGTVTMGVISGLNRSVGGLEGLIQTDAAINTGDSGGPLISASGEVIGINTLVVRSSTDGRTLEGLGFALPSNRVRQIAAHLISAANSKPPYIGLDYMDIQSTLPWDNNYYFMYTGVLVTAIDAGGPAAQAGLQRMDVILEIDGREVDKNHLLPSVLSYYKPGDSVTLTVLRGRQQMQVKMLLGQAPS